MELTNAGALVTGGASGLGEAAVRRLVQAGVTTVIFDLNQDRGANLAAELGKQAIFVSGDVTDAEQVNKALDALGKHPLRIVVSCAYLGAGVPLLDAQGVPHALEQFRRGVDVTLTGTFNVMRLAAARMAKTEPDADGQRGVVINVGSIVGIDGHESAIAYAGAKAAVIGMTLPAARDLAPHGIRVMTIAPGSFKTPAIASLPAKAITKLTESTLLPVRFGDPDEFARLVMHIADNSYLNAETIRLDAGARLSGTRR